jgi:chloramphenicol 3-O-phosphotransferase
VADGPVPVLVVTGPIGAGKTTVTQAIGDALAAAGVPHALIDMDWLRASFPVPPGDRFNTRLGYRNLAAVARTFREAGSGRFVIADVVETREQLGEYMAAVPGASVTVVRLAVDAGENRRRIAHRAAGNDDPWEVDRAAELVGIMEANAVADLVIDTTGRSPGAIARDILTRLGWLPDTNA